MVKRRVFFAMLAGAAVAAAAFGTSAAAQTAYPERAIRWVVPSPAASPIDNIARRLAQSVSARLGVPVLVDNRAGAGGTIGAAEVAGAAPDGHTLLLSVGDPLISALATIKKLPYDPGRDFTFISKIAASGPVLVAHPSVAANSFSELAAGLKADGKALAYGSWGIGTLPAQVMHSAARDLHIELQEIPYRGSPPALQDVLGNQVPMTFTGTYVAAPMIAQGKLKALAVVGEQRSPLLPDVQTFEEAGLQGFVYINPAWVGLLGPAGLDSGVSARLEEAVRASVQDEAFQTFLGEIGFDALGTDAATFEQEYRAEVAIIPDLIRSMGVEPQ